MYRKFVLILFVFATFSISSLYAQTAEKEPFSRGAGKFVFTEYEPLKNRPITVYYYVPTKGDIKNMRVLFTMHGAERKGRIGVSIWRHFAERDGFIVISPEYNSKIYPGWAYQQGGVIRKRKVVPRERWTYSSIEPIFDYFKRITGSTAEVYDMWGHSAGGQFTHRFALAIPEARLNIAVAANPGTWTFPLIDGLPSKFDKGKVYGWNSSVKGTPMANEESIKRFLARKLYVHIGKLDTATSSKHFPKSKSALSQGKHRLARARNFYKTGKRVARRNGWEFNWEKVELKGVGHDGRGSVYGTWEKLENGRRRLSIDNYTTKSAYYLIFKKDQDTSQHSKKNKKR